MTAPRVVPDLLAERAAGSPGGVALRVGGGATLTWARWAEGAAAVARGLAGRGVRPGDRVALRVPERHWDSYALAYMGVLSAGGVAVPLGDRFSGPELARVLDHAGPVGVVEAGEGPDDGDGGRGPASWVAGVGRLGSEGGTGPEPPGPSGGDDLAEIIYTSGTTGVPKGVACTHLAILAHDPPPGAGPGDPGGPVHFLHAFPIGTQAAQESLRVPLRLVGRVAVAMPAFDPTELCALVERHGVAGLQLVPATARLLVDSGAWRHHDVSSLERVVLSSAPAPARLFAALAEAFPRASLWNAYALTEAGPARTMGRWDPRRPSAVGPPVGATEVLVVDGAGRPRPEGEVGEIWLRRPGTPARWYYRDPAATAVAFAGGWVHTGDLGRLDPDGVLHLVDRKKDLIIAGGANVSPWEVEQALAEHPAVVEAAVVGVPHEVLGEDVAAAVVVRVPTPARDLQDVVRARLAEHKVPHRVVLVDRLPRNASGKVVKAEVRRLLAAAAPPPAPPAPPRTPTEALVASVWEAVLDRRGLGPEDDFFALGGQSLAAAQIAARLGEALGRPVPVTTVFESPTVAELARALAPGGPVPA